MDYLFSFLSVQTTLFVIALQSGTKMLNLIDLTSIRGIRYWTHLKDLGVHQSIIHEVLNPYSIQICNLVIGIDV